MSKIPLIVVVGPTASGKTALAIDIANYVGGEIVSADSMQIYKYMDIGSAKPTAEEMSQAVHHLIGFLEPEMSSVLRTIPSLHIRLSRILPVAAKLP